MEKRIEHGLEMHMCFIDLENAYDRVNRAKLFSIFPDYEIPTKIIRLIEEMYDGIQIKIKLGDNISDPAEIDNGVRQCSLSCVLFNIYMNNPIVVGDRTQGCSREVPINNTFCQ